MPESFIFAPEGVVLDASLAAFAAGQQLRGRGRGGRSKAVIYSEERGRYVKPMFPKGNKVGEGRGSLPHRCKRHVCMCVCA